MILDPVYTLLGGVGDFGLVDRLGFGRLGVCAQPVIQCSAPSNDCRVCQSYYPFLPSSISLKSYPPSSPLTFDHG